MCGKHIQNGHNFQTRLKRDHHYENMPTAIMLCNEILKYFRKLILIQNTLREEFFAELNFSEFFCIHPAGINFPKFGFTEDFAGIDIRE